MEVNDNGESTTTISDNNSDESPAEELDEDDLCRRLRKRLKKATAKSSSSAAAAASRRDNIASMSEFDIRCSIQKCAVMIASAMLPDNGAKLKAYVNRLEEELQRRKIQTRRSQQDASGCKTQANSAAARVIDTKSLIRVCPSGCYDKDQAWEEKGRTVISQIFIFSENGYICGLQFQYVEDGKLVLSQTYGQQAGLNFKSVTFDDISEYITGVNGTFGYFNKIRAVNSITVETNRRIYQLFGRSEKGDTKFSYQFGPGNQFGGFHGTFSSAPTVMLTSIGVYVNPAIDLDVFLSPSA